jgi:putative tryptophan/tyrosine transport system substrate-binding protein
VLVRREAPLRSLSGSAGLIVAASAAGLRHRELIITLAARHKLPAVYFERVFVAAGGLFSYGPDQVDQYRKAADYVDRIPKMLWGGSGENISIAALSKPMEPRYDETQSSRL